MRKLIDEIKDMLECRQEVSQTNTRSVIKTKNEEECIYSRKRIRDRRVQNH